MSTSQPNRVSPRRWTAFWTGLVAAGALIAVAVSVIFIATTVANRSAHNGTATHSHSSPAYGPLIQYHGTGAAPTATGMQTMPARQSRPPYGQAEHSYGAVP
jgi:hypothetical protein